MPISPCAVRAVVEQHTCVTLSVGVAPVVASDTPESLLARADAALYKAKTAGRNCVFSNNGETIKPAAQSAQPAAAVVPLPAACEDVPAAGQPTS